MNHQTQQFYADIAADYHRIFADWHETIKRQADILDSLIRAQVSGDALTLLDCSCGIGTQALGLAARGFVVHATDLSPEAVERGQREAAALDISLTWGVADMRSLDTEVEGDFDVVLSCDNSWAHLLDDAAVAAAARAMTAKTRPGGLVLISIRDYDALAEARPASNGPHFFDDSQGKRIFFQVWDWSPDGERYTLHHYITYAQGDRWQVTHSATTLRALKRAAIESALRGAELIDLRWHLPAETGYHQPIITARKG